ncbi:MAG: cardiolipin synthase [Bacteroides sp.]|nr:cardiolipin synthase [Bacteroides sp.]
MIEWGIFNDIFAVAFNVLYFVIIIGTIIVVILDNRNPVKTMAWVLVLFFLPVVGLAFYFFFGRSTRKEKLISKKGYTRLIKRPMAEYQAQKAFKYPEDQHQLMRFFREINNALPFEGNKIEVYTDGLSMLQSLITEISKAQHHIHLQFYIFEDDSVGRLLRDLLMDKARQGVEVRLLYDDVGCWRVPHAFYEEMRGAGIEVRSFLKVRFPLFTSKVNYRNHRKIVVIDGRVAFTGGMNIALRYMRGFSWGIWRDTHIKIEGKAVYGLQTSFLTDWYVVDRTLITSSRYFPEVEACGNALIQIVTSDPVGEWRDIMQGLLIAISSSRKYFYIQTPYLLPTEPILLALKTAALAGVDIRIMIPERADTWLTHLGSLSYLDDMMRAGVKIYLYQKGFLHSKLMVSDDTLSTVGSTNMDFRSFEHNFEVNAFMYDTASALALKEIFLQDQKDAILLQRKTWMKRPWYQKAKESIVRLLAPLL